MSLDECHRILNPQIRFYSMFIQLSDTFFPHTVDEYLVFLIAKCYPHCQWILISSPVTTLRLNFLCAVLSQVVELFSNVTWTKADHTVHEFEIVENWRTPWTGIFINLLIYMVFTVRTFIQEGFGRVFGLADISEKLLILVWVGNGMFTRIPIFGFYNLAYFHASMQMK